MSAVRVLQIYDQRTIDIVFGYIKSLESLFKLTNMPEGIRQICLMYYYITEFFNNARPDCFKISQDKLAVTNIKYCTFGRHTIYGKLWIPSTSKSIHKWTLHIHVATEMYLGLSSNDNYVDSDFSSDLESDTPNYAMSNRGARYKNGERFFDELDINITEFTIGDTVTFILDLFHANILYKVNDKSEIIIFDQIQIDQDIQYIMVIQIKMPNDFVTIANYTVSSRNALQ
eukprot:UN10894